MTRDKQIIFVQILPLIQKSCLLQGVGIKILESKQEPDHQICIIV